MAEITIERNPSEERLNALGVKTWPIWTKEVSEFPWSYDMTETCYILEGRVQVTPDGGQPVEIQPGDLVTFPQGLSCTWQVLDPVRKHYEFS